jgi:indolepyruvate ferredoxin oxidoreductase
MIPVLNPAGMQEYLELGLHGWAMSRYSGCWVAFKALADTIDSAPRSIDPTSVRDRAARPNFADAARRPEHPLARRRRWTRRKRCCTLRTSIYAANRLRPRQQAEPHRLIDSPARGSASSRAASPTWTCARRWRTSASTRRPPRSASASSRSAMPWPLEPDGIREFAEGLEEILVVEEKRQLIEYQLKEQLYNWPRTCARASSASSTRRGEWAAPHQLAAAGEGRTRSPAMIARVIAGARALPRQRPRPARLAFLEAKEPCSRRPRDAAAHPRTSAPAARTTPRRACRKAAARWPASAATSWRSGWTADTADLHADGRRGRELDRPGAVHRDEARLRRTSATARTSTPARWRSAPRSRRASTMTYKILFNDAVAMTGGQPHDGQLNVPQITQQMSAEGVKRIAVVTDEPDKYGGT